MLIACSHCQVQSIKAVRAPVERQKCLSLSNCTVSIASEVSAFMQNGWNVKELVGIWHVLVNMVNFADLTLHLLYMTILWQGLKCIAAAGPKHVLWHQPAAVASVGVCLAFMMARWLPRHGHSQFHGQEE